MVKHIILFIILSLNLLCLSSNAQELNNGINWPSFRGENASGVSEGFSTPVSWSLEESKNIKWKAKIPGLGFSSPVIWGDKIFLTTAISGVENPELKVGRYGSIKPVEDETEHTWKVFCIDKNSGNMLWEKTSHVGVPKVKRHPKSTHANSTCATNGKYVVAFFGSEGLYCYDMDGDLIWKKDFGVLDSGFFMVKDAQWGFASSPIIHEDKVIVQCDVQENSFIAALDLQTGEEIWRRARDEYPTWSTPTILKNKDRIQIVVNGFKHIGGYDFNTGKEIWKMHGGGDIPVPTPVVAHDMIFINSAHGRMSPIYAIKQNAKGEITLREKTSNDYIVWSIRRGGAYMQTPLVYGDYLYNLVGAGRLTCFNAKSGKEIYKKSLGNMNSFSASGVAADGKLYFPSEQGNVFVVKDGPTFELLSANEMNDICMATPAISEGDLYIRTHHYLVAISDKKEKE